MAASIPHMGKQAMEEAVEVAAVHRDIANFVLLDEELWVIEKHVAVRCCRRNCHCWPKCKAVERNVQKTHI